MSVPLIQRMLCWSEGNWSKCGVLDVNALFSIERCAPDVTVNTPRDMLAKVHKVTFPSEEVPERRREELSHSHIPPIPSSLTV